MTAPDVRTLRRLLWVAVALIAAGVWAFVLRGADGPADPSVGAAPSAVEGPGDPERVLLPGFDEISISVQPGDGRGLLEWCLLAAQNREQRSRGLMGVTSLQGYSGMAFVYQEDNTSSFYMRNTPTPLSIAFIDAEGGLVSSTDMAPCPDQEGCPLYPADGPYRMAIEVFQGGLDDLGITPGSTTEITDGCADNTSA